MIELWNTLLIKPMLNSLIVLYDWLFNDFGLAIIAFTLVVRAIITPLTLKQIRSTQTMSALQPKLQELQKKYAKDKQKLSQETMKLYKSQGVNPLGCLGPMLIQMPIWIALYTVILKALAATPEDLLDLSKYLYSWPQVQQLVPLKENFLWLNLGQPDPIYLLPILVGGGMWVQQKMTMLHGGDPRQQSMNRMMLWMMPIMFGLFTVYFASGLALFWVVSTGVGIATQYFVTGWGGLLPRASVPTPSPVRAEKRTENGQPRKPREPERPGVQRQERGRGHQAGVGKAGPYPRPGRNNRPKKR